MAEYLDSLVAGLSTPALVVALAATVAGLAKGADWMVDSAVALSERWGVPRVVIGATIVSLGTTTPEAVVSVVAALQGRSEMALGNAVGSIICNTGLILGIGCLIRPLPLDLRVVNRQGWGKVVTGILLVLVCLPWADPASAFTAGGTLPQVAGWFFLGLLVVYMVWSVRLARAGVGAGGAAAVTTGGLAADPIFFVMHFPAMLFLILVFRVGIQTARHGALPRTAGAALLGTYVAVTGLSYLVSAPAPGG